MVRFKLVAVVPAVLVVSFAHCVFGAVITIVVSEGRVTVIRSVGTGGATVPIVIGNVAVVEPAAFVAVTVSAYLPGAG